jgi:hypothetical protein
MPFKKKDDSNAQIVGAVDKLTHVAGTTCAFEIKGKVLVCNVSKLKPPSKQLKQLLNKNNG